MMFATPKSIQHLATDDHDGRSLQQFGNLTHLELNKIRHSHLDLIPAIARRSHLPHLKELHCNVEYLEIANDIVHPEHLELLAAIYDRLRSEPPTVRAEYPKIHFQGIPLDLDRPFEEYRLEGELICAHLESPMLERAQHRQIIKCYYAGSVERLAISRPSDVSWTYPNIRIFFVVRERGSPPVNHDQLLNFLRHLNSLVWLELVHTGLSTRFFKDLCKVKDNSTHTIASKLNFLTIIDNPEYRGMRFDFVERCPHLRHLFTNQAIKDEVLRVLELKDARPSYKLRFDFLTACDKKTVPGAEADTRFTYFRWEILKGLLFYSWREPEITYELTIYRSWSEDHPFEVFHQETTDNLRELSRFIERYMNAVRTSSYVQQENAEFDTFSAVIRSIDMDRPALSHRLSRIDEVSENSSNS